MEMPPIRLLSRLSTKSHLKEMREIKMVSTRNELELERT